MSHGASAASAILSTWWQTPSVSPEKEAEAWLIMDHFHPVIPGTEAKWQHSLSLSGEEEEEGAWSAADIYSSSIHSLVVFTVLGFPSCPAAPSGLPASQSGTARWPAASSPLRPRSGSSRRLVPNGAAARARMPSWCVWASWRTGHEGEGSPDCGPRLETPDKDTMNLHVKLFHFLPLGV